MLSRGVISSATTAAPLGRRVAQCPAQFLRLEPLSALQILVWSRLFGVRRVRNIDNTVVLLRVRGLTRVFYT